MSLTKSNIFKLLIIAIIASGFLLGSTQITFAQFDLATCNADASQAQTTCEDFCERHADDELFPRCDSFTLDRTAEISACYSLVEKWRDYCPSQCPIIKEAHQNICVLGDIAQSDPDSIFPLSLCQDDINTDFFPECNTECEASLTQYIALCNTMSDSLKAECLEDADWLNSACLNYCRSDLQVLLVNTCVVVLQDFKVFFEDGEEPVTPAQTSEALSIDACLDAADVLYGTCDFGSNATCLIEKQKAFSSCQNVDTSASLGNTEEGSNQKIGIAAQYRDIQNQGIIFAGICADVDADCPCRDRGDCELSDILQVIVNISVFILGISGSILLLVIFYGGFLWITAHGNTQMIETGKKSLIGGVIGIAIIFGAYATITLLIGVLKTGEIPDSNDTIESVIGNNSVIKTSDE